MSSATQASDLEETVSYDWHYPVLGIGFTLDTPRKVSHFGFNSVMSLADDNVIELLRAKYAGLLGEDYDPITKKDDDHRANRITGFLNLVQKLVDQNFERLKTSSFDDPDLNKTFQMLAEEHPLRILYDRFNKGETNLEDRLRSGLRKGSIDVNIMTKLDLADPKHQDDPFYTEAKAALRGYAESDLESSVVFSAGWNPTLFTYLGTLEQFKPDENGNLKKKVILKVSDYRSAEIQAKKLAQLGIWVSEFRIESGLNCGGHAFGNRYGQMVGPIIDEFDRERDNLHELLLTSYKEKIGRDVSFERAKLTYQGGIKNNDDVKQFRSKVDSVGVGTLALYCPEVTSVLPENLELLKKAGKDDVVLSDSSPLGIPFWMLAYTAGHLQRLDRIENGEPGVNCTYAKLLSQYPAMANKMICAASKPRVSSELKIIDELDDPLEKEYKTALTLAKQCLCPGLSRDVQYLLGLSDDFKNEHAKSVVCAGPSAQYIDRTYTLLELAQLLNGEGEKKTLPFAEMDEIKINLEKLQKDIKNIGFKEFYTKERNLIKATLEGINKSIDFYTADIDHFHPRQEGVSGILREYQKTLNELQFQMPVLN